MWQPAQAETREPWFPGRRDWPISIHGNQRSGCSFFTIALAATAIRRGYRVVLICAHAEAIRQLTSELDLRRPFVGAREVTSTTASSLADAQLVTLLQRPKTRPIDGLRALSDWHERVVIIHNAELTLTPELWSIIQPHRERMIAGDFFRLTVTPDAMKGTRIAFSRAPQSWSVPTVVWPSYIGQAMQGRQVFQLITGEAHGVDK